MANADIKSNVDVDQSFVKAAVTATANGASFEISDYHAISVLIDVGTWTDGTHTFTIEESDDNSAWSTVTTDIWGDTPAVVSDATTDDTKFRIGYKGNNRFLRVVTTVAGATSGAVYGALILKGQKSEGLL